MSEPAAARSSAPVNAVIEGPSFPLRVRCVATVLLVSVLAMAARLWQRWPPGGADTPTALGLVGVAAVVLLGYLSILRSRTSLDEEAVTQRWLFTKRVRLDEITQARLIDPPALRWLIVPRFVVRTRGLRVLAFHLGDERLVSAARALLDRGRRANSAG